MGETWNRLVDAGVPHGALRRLRPRALDDGALAEALAAWLETAHSAPLDEHECVGAWLAAFEHHYPARYSRTLGVLGPRARAAVHALDAERFLKLRRIALENLAARL